MPNHLSGLTILFGLVISTFAPAQDSNGLTPDSMLNRSGARTAKFSWQPASSFSQVTPLNPATQPYAALSQSAGLVSEPADSVSSRGPSALPFAALFNVEGNVLVARRRLNLLGALQVDAGARLWGNQIAGTNPLIWRGQRLNVEVIQGVYYVYGPAR